MATTPTASAWSATSPNAHGLDLRARRTLLIGAGGAARGVAPALLDARSATCSSSTARPNAPTRSPMPRLCPVACIRAYLEDVGTLGNFDLSSTPRRHARGSDLPSLPVNLLAPRGRAVDLSYGEAAVPFSGWAARRARTTCIDGLGMLVEQARKASSAGTRCDRKPMRSTRCCAIASRSSSTPTESSAWNAANAAARAASRLRSPRPFRHAARQACRDSLRALDDDYRCRLFGKPERPAFCASLKPLQSMCGHRARKHWRCLPHWKS
jgi:hypothetical protein